MTTIIKAAGAADFLSLVPHLAGYTPTESLALVPFHRGRTLGVMRFDLPPDDADVAVDRIAATLIGMVCKLADADGVAPVVFTDAPFRVGGTIARAALVHAVIKRADACGLTVSDALCRAGDGWGSYLDPDCPESGHPLIELGRDDPLGEDRDVAGDQAAGLELPHADLAEKERLARAMEGIEAAAGAICGDEGGPGALGVIDPLAIAAAGALDDLPALFEEALGWDVEHLEPHDAAALLWCIARPGVRDIALSQWYADIDAGDDALEAQLRWQGGVQYPEHLARFMFGEGPRPRVERVEAALALMRRLAAAAPHPLRVGPLAVAAWLSWALGHSTAADWHVQRALEIDPDHVLAGIVGTFVAAGHLPDWAFERHRSALPAARVVRDAG